MRKDKEKAIELRRTGKSYLEIKKELGVPKSTLSEWFKDQKWSNKISKGLSAGNTENSIIRLKLLNNIRGENLKMLYLNAEKEAEEEFQKLKYHPLFVSVLMIYWGEGDKVTKGRCTIANTEPKMMKMYFDFLKNICRAEPARIKAWILLYPDLDDEVCKKYWMQNTGLKQGQFNKSIVIHGKSTKSKLKYGVLYLGYSSSYLKVKILKWIELLADDIIAQKYNK